MTAALDAIRARHFPDPVYEPGGPLGHKNAPECIACGQKPLCDAAQLLAALDRAEAVATAARDLLRCIPAYVPEHGGPLDVAIRQALAALRAYEDADKVADDA